MHVIGTAGHVDHGKSTLIEKLTGMDPDRFEEEKRRGLTIDLGFAWLTTPAGREVGIIDVPGHERFIKNMLAGAGGISVCLFVVDATEGWRPQSTEHLAILDLLGLDRGVVALTKADLADEETLELALADVDERIAGSTLGGAQVIPVSAVTGLGTDELLKALDAVLASTPEPIDAGRPRLWIDRSFKIAGAGTVVTGTLAGGGLQVGDTVEVVPGESRARVRSIQSHKKKTESIGPGNRVAVNLVGIDADSLERGAALVAPDQWRPTDSFDALVEVLPSSLMDTRRKLTERGAFLIHAGTAESAVRISLLDGRAIAAGDKGYARIWLKHPLPLTRGDRFVLRDAGRGITFGGGRVLDPQPPKRRRADKERRLTLLGHLENDAPDDALRAVVDFERRTPVDAALFRTGLQVVPTGIARLGDTFVSGDERAALGTNVRNILQQWHEAKPLERGIPREDLRRSLALSSEEFDALLSTLDDVEDDGGRVHLAEFRVELDPEQERQEQELYETIESLGYSPPFRSELHAPDALLRSLTEAGKLVPVGDFYLTAGQAQDARQKVRAHIEDSGPVSVAQVRDLLGTSRKYAVPLCEWLDSSGATMRRGDLRVLGPVP